MLLGILIGHARTPGELHALISEAVACPEVLALADDLPPTWGAPGIALRSLADCGPDGIRDLLVRLEDVGLARSVRLDESEIWTACP